MSTSETLTERERGILARLAGGLSDQQIARDLHLSLNTVKWYNRQIYGKLGVHNRLQAIAEARAAGLLASPGGAAPEPKPAQAQAGAPLAHPAAQRVYFTRSRDGTRLAFAISGDGPPLVRVANHLSHLEYDWDSPVWVHWLQELTRAHTLIHADMRGSGLSDWDMADVSFETWVQDLEAVVDAAGLQRFPLFAMSAAGPVAVAYAARHPERVSRLVLHGAYARGWLKRDLTPRQAEEERLMISLMRVGWGHENPAFRQVFATQIFPDATTAELRALERQMRVSMSVDNAMRLETEMHQVDVRHLAPLVQAPALVLHSRHDGGTPFEEGRLLASLLPRAQFVPLESRNHLVTKQEPAWARLVEAMRAFLAEPDSVA